MSENQRKVIQAIIESSIVIICTGYLIVFAAIAVPVFLNFPITSDEVRMLLVVLIVFSAVVGKLD